MEDEIRVGEGEWEGEEEKGRVRERGKGVRGGEGVVGIRW